MSDFGDLGVTEKLALPSFLRFWVCTEASLGSRDAVLRTEAVRVFPMPRGHFSIEIPT
jgi:hypothetical protein